MEGQLTSLVVVVTDSRQSRVIEATQLAPTPFVGFIPPTRRAPPDQCLLIGSSECAKEVLIQTGGIRGRSTVGHGRTFRSYL